MKRILFIGGNGFLGQNVSACIKHNYMDLERVHFWIVGRKVPALNEKNYPNCHILPLDYSQKNELSALFKQEHFDEVFHFVNTSVPSNSNTNIRKDIEDNLISTVQLLELMVKYKVLKITFLSSGGAVYGDALPSGFQEHDFNNPNNSYGIVKLAIEKYIALFHKLYGLDYLILRVSNSFGPYHESKHNGITNIAIRKALKQNPVVVWGEGKNKKDYIYAPDFARIFWELYFKKIKNKILNIGSGNLYSVLDILHAIKEINPSLTWSFESAKPFDTANVEFKLDALQQLIAPCTTNFNEVIRTTYEWEKSQL